MRRTLFLAGMFLVGAVAGARAESRSVRIDYAAAPSCPDERRFVELARDRVERWATIEEHGELVARARAEEKAGVFVGSLSLEDSAGRSLGVRTIQDADCEEVVLALALFLAVALEAEASNPHPPADVVAEAPAVVNPPAAARPPGPVPAPPPEPRPQSARSIEWQLAARVHGIVGRTPDPTPGVALAVELAPARRASLLRPFGGIGIDAAPYSERREGRGHVELGWGALFGRACVGLDLAKSTAHPRDGWGIEPWACARVEGGALRAASRGYAVNRTEHLGWYAAGVEAGASVRLSQIISVGVFGHGMAPFLRHELALGERRVYRMPNMTGEAGLELKVRIW